MPTLPVTNFDEHAVAMVRLEELMLMNPPEGSAGDRELDELAIDVEAFGKQHCFKGRFSP